MVSIALLFLAVFVLNVLPAFAPPTWMVMSFFGLRYPNANVWFVAFIAASAATGGRIVLAYFAQQIARSRWVRLGMRDNLDMVADAIERRRTASVMAFLLLAFSPLPSNVLFLAYGLTGAPLSLLAIPFFVGRFLSYGLAFTGGAGLSRHFDSELNGAASGIYFVLSQLAYLALLYGFTRIDWRRTIAERRLHWIRC